MARRVFGMIGCLLLALSLSAVGSPAQAQACYPPPCEGGPAPVTSVDPAVQVNGDVISASGGVATRSAAPFAIAGLLMVMTVLTTLCVGRRASVASAARTEPAGLPVGIGARERSPA